MGYVTLDTWTVSDHSKYCLGIGHKVRFLITKDDSLIWACNSTILDRGFSFIVVCNKGPDFRWYYLTKFI